MTWSQFFSTNTSYKARLDKISNKNKPIIPPDSLADAVTYEILELTAYHLGKYTFNRDTLTKIEHYFIHPKTNQPTKVELLSSEEKKKMIATNETSFDLVTNIRINWHACFRFGKDFINQSTLRQLEEVKDHILNPYTQMPEKPKPLTSSRKKWIEAFLIFEERLYFLREELAHAQKENEKELNEFNDILDALLMVIETINNDIANLTEKVTSLTQNKKESSFLALKNLYFIRNKLEDLRDNEKKQYQATQHLLEGKIKEMELLLIPYKEKLAKMIIEFIDFLNDLSRKYEDDSTVSIIDELQTELMQLMPTPLIAPVIQQMNKEEVAIITQHHSTEISKKTNFELCKRKGFSLTGLLLPYVKQEKKENDTPQKLSLSRKSSLEKVD